MINLVIMAMYLKPIGTVDYSVVNHFLNGVIAMSAIKALDKEKIDSLEKLSGYSENEILQLHGFGKIAMIKLKIYLKENNISLKNH